MKLAISTLGCPDWTWETILNNWESYGIEGIEVRGLDGEMDADKIRAFLPEQQEATLAQVNAHHLKLIGFGSSCSFHAPEKYDAAIQQGKTAIDVCSRMGIPFVRVFGDAFPKQYSREEVLDRVTGGLKELCAYAAAKNVCIYQEIHGEFNTIEALTPVLEAMKDVPNFGILWDIEHSDRAYHDEVEPFYQLIRPFIRHVHIKDYFRAVGETPFRLCQVGEGEIPIPMLIAWLKRDGYEGYLSLEWEKKWHPELPEPGIAFPAYARYIRTLL